MSLKIRNTREPLNSASLLKDRAEVGCGSTICCVGVELVSPRLLYGGVDKGLPYKLRSRSEGAEVGEVGDGCEVGV